MDWPADLTGGLLGSGNSPAPYSVFLLKPGFPPSRISSRLHPHSRTTIWSALDWISNLSCRQASKQPLSLTPCIHPAHLTAGWLSASPPSSHRLGCSPDPSSVCIVHRASLERCRHRSLKAICHCHNLQMISRVNQLENYLVNQFENYFVNQLENCLVNQLENYFVNQLENYLTNQLENCLPSNAADCELVQDLLFSQLSAARSSTQFYKSI